MAETTAEDIFLPEKVVDSGFGQQDGKRYYKVKWVRYTWEAEDTLSHLKEMLDAFWNEHGGMPELKLKEANIITEETVSTETKDTPKGEVKDQIPEAEATPEQVNNEGKGLASVLLKPTVPKTTTTTLSTLQAITALQNITGGVSTTQSTYTDENGKEVKYITLEKHTCDVCLRVFNSTQALRTHKRSAHKAEKQFQCETCLKMFSEKSTLRRHMYIHLDEKPFKCDHCDKGFSDKSTLRRHLVTHTGIKRFQCNCCDKRFTRNEHLRQHMYIHTAEKIYKCDVCLKNFRQRSTLKNHMLLHRADNAIKCELCGALYGKQMQLDKHLVWCNGSTSTYKCDECDKSFQDRSGLKRHMLLHSGVRPFKCEYCDQTFNDRSILRRHIFKHTDKKPFQCAVCNKEFLRKATLQSHVAREHSDEVDRSLFGNLVHAYDMSDGLSLNESGLDQHVQFVIQPDDTEVDDNINQVEVSTNDLQQTNDGVSVLAHAVCSIPENSLLANLDNKQVVQTNQPMKLLNQDLQPGENQLLQVQIIQMEDGHQIVQSIQALNPSDNSLVVQGETQTLNIQEQNVDDGNVALSIDEVSASYTNNHNTLTIQNHQVTSQQNIINIEQATTLTDRNNATLNIHRDDRIEQTTTLTDQNNANLNIHHDEHVHDRNEHTTIDQSQDGLVIEENLSCEIETNNNTDEHL